ncbi:YceI family protein [Actimicrobium sp. CCI2.3]|uniref:YceI family protein n=1 Tax=Actimicrobium sp. CCI2.3 TaxID=3048616 RepID=UPI002AB41A8D|nr:YceI family protein [Actimicrobium sp. CCI2.3]MDY7575052.1 YceI family protein [Actimicrobium sp. CCI2.3]MEB0021378.1 YceI family protein [Actimicrobium sp. CCI2.3]
MRAIELSTIGLVLALFAASATAQVDLAKSTVSATAKQIGVPIEGKFGKLSATIKFNPAQLAQSSAKVDIDVASYDMGSAEYNKEVTGKEWFNAGQFPKATFVSGAITAAGAGKYNVAGKLTLKGKSVDVIIPFSVKPDGATQVFDGVLPIKRTVFNIGDGEWKDTSVVADEVVIKFHLVVANAK